MYTRTRMGLAKLFPEGVSHASDSQVLYCPSWKHPYHQYGVIDTAGIDPTFGPNQFGGYPRPGGIWPTRHVGISYHYRSTFRTDGEAANSPANLMMSNPSATPVNAPSALP